MNKREKYVDESWKETVAHDKEVHSTIPSGKGSLKETIKSTDEDIPPRISPQNNAQDPGLDEHHDHDLDHESIPQGQDAGPAPDINFLNYIASLGYQAMIFMGVIPNPITNEIDQNLDQAKFLIDTILMIRTKTKGNLNQQESDMLNTTLYQLQMKFLEISQKGGQP